MMRRIVSFWPLMATAFLLVIALGFFLLIDSIVLETFTDNGNDTPPTLLDGYVNPWYGAPNDTYTFSIVCKNPNGNAPEYVHVVVNGSILNLTPFPGAQNDFKSGVPYIVKTHFPIGNYSFYFEVADNKRAIRFPENEEDAFIVADLDIYLANASVSPIAGTIEDTYTFTVTYVGPHRPWGTGIRLHVFSYRTPISDEALLVSPPPPLIYNRIPQTDPIERNYTAGVEFRLSLTLDPGIWWYYYACNSTFHYPYFRAPNRELARGANEEFFPGPWVEPSQARSANLRKRVDSLSELRRIDAVSSFDFLRAIDKFIGETESLNLSPKLKFLS
ncbi:MAG: hypothetical protein ACE5OZ_13590 [Candidatus Heimdallarchaeota archaeon]